MKRLIMVCLLIVLPFLCCSCEKRTPQPPSKHKKLAVVTTLFPVYDFARNIGGEKAEVSLLLPPGVEPHSYEPKPADAVKLSSADLFVFTNEKMEPWVRRFVQGVDAGGVTVVDSSQGITLAKDAEAVEKAAHHDAGLETGHHGGLDPHVWLDLANAQLMVDNIATAMSRKDPPNKQYYQAQAQAYKDKLKKLDAQFRDGLASCSKRTFLHGGHYAFGYLAKRYALRYESASAVNADAEPSPARLAALVDQMKKLGLKYVFSEELLSPRVAEVLARETGAKVLMLHAAHNVGKQELAQGVTFISLMEKNLLNLRIGMECGR